MSSISPLWAAAALEAELATSPVRNVVVTGANSGVGLNGASRLVAAGHHVTVLCRNQAKADGAAEACKEYANKQQASGSSAFREGGSVVSVIFSTKTGPLRQ
jgi:NAD(P)-dependent dehydrogenase (short-subunit alcohol dehydrogenase family)